MKNPMTYQLFSHFILWFDRTNNSIKHFFFMMEGQKPTVSQTRNKNKNWNGLIVDSEFVQTFGKFIPKLIGKDAFHVHVPFRLLTCLTFLRKKNNCRASSSKSCVWVTGLSHTSINQVKPVKNLIISTLWPSQYWVMIQ